MLAICQHQILINLHFGVFDYIIVVYTESKHMITDKNIGEWLRTKRKAKGFSTRYVARQLGFSEGMPSLWENGKRSISAETFFEYCDLIGADPQELIVQYKKETLHGKRKVHTT
jgi:predicted transcriptional regulator